MTIKDELLALKNEEGFCVAEEVREWAKQHPESALHGAIQWDVEKAAHEYQLWQIRRLISIHVVTIDGDRKFVSLSIDRTREGGGYRDIDEVMPVPDLRKIMLDDALRELERLQAKYNRVVELAQVWTAANEARARHGRRSPARRGVPAPSPAQPVAAA